MTFDFVLNDNEEIKANILKELDILVPVEKYSIGFKCYVVENTKYFIKIFLVKSDETIEIYESNYYYNEETTQVKKLVCLSKMDDFWNMGLDAYRAEQSSKQNVTIDPNSMELQKAKNKILSLHGINGVKYARKFFTFAERNELRKLGYYDYVSDTGQYTFFEKILDSSTNREKVSLKRIKILLKGVQDFQSNKSNNILFYSESFLSDEALEKIYELSLLDSKTSNQLLDIKELIDNERNEYERICEITANKKKKDLNDVLEMEKIKYMVENGISLQEAFYHVDKNAQLKKEKILNCYIEIVNNSDVSAYNEDIVYIAKYLNDNIEKRNVERIIDYILIDDENIIDKKEVTEEELNHISFLKLKLRSENNDTEIES